MSCLYFNKFCYGAMSIPFWKLLTSLFNWTFHSGSTPEAANVVSGLDFIRVQLLFSCWEGCVVRPRSHLVLGIFVVSLCVSWAFLSSVFAFWQSALGLFQPTVRKRSSMAIRLSVNVCFRYRSWGGEPAASVIVWYGPHQNFRYQFRGRNRVKMKLRDKQILGIR